MKFIRPLTIIILAFFIAAAALWWLSLPSKETAVTIPQGASAKEIALILKKSNIVSNEPFFRFAVHLSGRSKELKAGTYFLAPRTSILSVIQTLTRGRAGCVRVTIPEGFTAGQIAERMAAECICGEEEFVKIVKRDKLEGYLFPETYYFELNTPAEKVSDAMVRQFRKNFSSEFKERLTAFKMSEKDAVTLASIIEKEAVLENERPLISAVFHNRLKKHWYLESCATVSYALGEHKKSLLYKDLKVNSPYNTYRYYGLPPGPICSPGLGSLWAALYPQDSEDMFFVVKSSGAHSFSRYYSEHLKNKLRVKKISK
jgi:UPF0755 protein